MEERRRYKQISELKDLCAFYIDYIDRIGNECAYTDRIVEQIKDTAQSIKEFDLTNEL